jgi:hypothetical protein
MNKQLRYLMIKSAHERIKSKSRMRLMSLQFEREIIAIEGEDPLCTLRKSLKNNSK